MNTAELAKELDALARSLRALTYQARGSVQDALELERRRSATSKPEHKFEPRELTLHAIARAIAAASRKPAVSVDLRQDVYTRRVERHAEAFATRFEAWVKAGVLAPAGARFVNRFTRLTPDVHSIFDATPGGRTAIDADVRAWFSAARYTLARIVPAYNRDAIRRYVESALDGAGFDPLYDLEQKIAGAVDTWLELNSVLLCETNDAGKVARVNGLDPAPFAALHALVQAGNPDPLGILQS